MSTWILSCWAAREARGEIANAVPVALDLFLLIRGCSFTRTRALLPPGHLTSAAPSAWNAFLPKSLWTAIHPTLSCLYSNSPHRKVFSKRPRTPARSPFALPAPPSAPPSFVPSTGGRFPRAPACPPPGPDAAWDHEAILKAVALNPGAGVFPLPQVRASKWVLNYFIRKNVGGWW